MERAKQALRDAAAEFFAREASPQSLLTITRANISSNFMHASVYLSVLPKEKEIAALGLANRSVPEFKKFLKTRVRLPRMPHIEFIIDEGDEDQ